MARIRDLPPEVVQLIAGHLDQESLLAFRRTCHGFEENSFPLFASTFFDTVGFIFVCESLEVLVNLAKHEQLRKYIRHVWFAPEFFLRTTINIEQSIIVDGGKSCSMNSQTEQQIRLIEKWEAKRDECIKSTALHKTLADAFSQMPNVATFGLRYFADPSHRDYQAISSAANIRQHCWGRRMIQSQTGIDPLVALGREKSGVHMPGNMSTTLFSTLLSILGQSSLKIPKLYTSGPSSHKDVAQILPDHLEVRNEVFYKSNNPLSGLQDLCLSMGTFRWLQHGLAEREYGRGLKLLLGTAPNLTCLRLDFARSEMRDPYALEMFKRTFEKIKLKCLFAVSVEGIDLDSDILGLLISPSKFTLRKVTVNVFDWPRRIPMAARPQYVLDWLQKEYNVNMIRIKAVAGLVGETDLVSENGVGRMALPR